MRGMRSTAAVIIGILLATGLVRGAGTQFGALRKKAQKALESAGAKKDVAIDDDDSSGTPALTMASILQLAPGAQGRVSATGNWGAKTSFAVSGRGFTLTDPAVGKGTFEGTLAAAAGLLPSAAVLRATNRHGTGETIAAYVGGNWRVEGTTDNGWRVRMTTVPPKRRGTLAFKAEFFEGTGNAPFTTRDAEMPLERLEEEGASYTVSFLAPSVLSGLDDAECDPIMQRANELAGKLMNATSQAEEDRISAEVDRIQDKIDGCIERRQENADKVAATLKAAEARQRADAAKFGCGSFGLTVAPDGTATGSLTCTTGSPSFKGTLKPGS